MEEVKSKFLNIEEAEYRDLDYCSYSLLSKLDKHDNRVSLEIKKETPALMFGSLVDCLVLTEEDFTERFDFVIETPTASAKVLADYLIGIEYSITNVEKQKSRLLEILNELSLWTSLKENNRIAKLDKNLIEYINHYIKAKSKTPITQEDYERANQIKIVLESHPLTSKLFTHEHKLTQVNGMSVMDGVTYKFMCDLIIIDHEQKKIHVYDLKTGSAPISRFESNFLEYRYDIQYYLYTKGIEDIKAELVSGGEDYTVEPLQFIYIDKGSPEIPTIYKVPENLNIYEGYTTKYGWNMRGVKELLQVYKFYSEEGFVIPKRWKENLGIITLEI
jgi:hypothetical protein